MPNQPTARMSANKPMVRKKIPSGPVSMRLPVAGGTPRLERAKEKKGAHSQDVRKQTNGEEEDSQRTRFHETASGGRHTRAERGQGNNGCHIQQEKHNQRPQEDSAQGLPLCLEEVRVAQRRT